MVIETLGHGNAELTISPVAILASYVNAIIAGRPSSSRGSGYLHQYVQYQSCGPDRIRTPDRIGIAVYFPIAVLIQFPCHEFVDFRMADDLFSIVLLFYKMEVCVVSPWSPSKSKTCCRGIVGFCLPNSTRVHRVSLGRSPRKTGKSYGTYGELDLGRRFRNGESFSAILRYAGGYFSSFESFSMFTARVHRFSLSLASAIPCASARCQ